jgi:2-polyprenyl-6-methoxyphenol hydroxylase-like FAD-dependent oxidoreductase
VNGQVAVIGGGIGGLSTALALHRRGIDCAVYERAPEIHEIGSAIGIWPSAIRVFDRLGVGDAVRALGGAWTYGGLRRYDGKYLMRYTSEQFAARLGEPMIGVHRGELQALLLNALPDGMTHTNKELASFDDHGGGVTARFVDGTSIETPVLIAADGRRSSVRTTLFGTGELHDCGVMGWRGTPSPAPAGSDWNEFTGEFWGPDGRFGVLPIGGGRVCWFGVARQFRSGGLDEVAERFGAWAHPIPALIAATNEEHVWRDRLDDMWPRMRWTKGRVALLGDAAHPMTPDLGLGACIAIMDAEVLAEELAGGADTADALRRYNKRRRRKAAKVVLAARAMTMGARSENPAAVRARIRLMALGPPPSIMLRQFKFLADGP